MMWTRNIAWSLRLAGTGGCGLHLLYGAIFKDHGFALATAWKVNQITLRLLVQIGVYKCLENGTVEPIQCYMDENVSFLALLDMCSSGAL